MVEHSERESHLTPQRDALQWTIFGPVTIQHQNRQIKITWLLERIDVADASGGASQLSHQTPRGFGSLPLSRRAVAATKSRFRSVKSLDVDRAFRVEANVGDEHAHIPLSIAREARDTADVNHVLMCSRSET